MRKERRRPMHYHAHSLCDGTILVALPARKPTPKVIKRDHLTIDPEGVCAEWPVAGAELPTFNKEVRDRLNDIMATRLNTRRAIRELVLPELAAIREELAALRSQLDGLSRQLDHLHGHQPQG